MFIERLKIMVGCWIVCLILFGMWLLGGVDSSIVELAGGLMLLVPTFWAITAEPEKDSSKDEKES